MDDTPWSYVPGRGIRTVDDKFVGDAWPPYRKRIIETVNEAAAAMLKAREKGSKDG